MERKANHWKTGLFICTARICLGLFYPPPEPAEEFSIYPAHTERPDWQPARTSTEAQCRLPIIF